MLAPLIHGPPTSPLWRPLGMIALAAGALLTATGCVVYSDDVVYETVHHPPPAAYNYTPVVLGAEAGVFWDAAWYDDIWYFDALVDDPDGPYDVVAVWADVWDEYRGVWVDSFELYPTDDPWVWYAEYTNAYARLDPYYPGYTVDFVVYDSWEDYDWLTVWAWTY